MHDQKTVYETMKDIFERMPFEFTSNQFYKELRKSGVPKRLYSGGRVAPFLHKRADNGKKSGKTWVKKVEDKNQTSITFQEQKAETTTNWTPAPSDIEYSIALLKSLGYRIQKPEWIDL